MDNEKLCYTSNVTWCGDLECTCYTLSTISVHIFNVYLTIQFPKGVFHLLTHFNTHSEQNPIDTHFFRNQKCNAWQMLRFIVAHSAEICGWLDSRQGTLVTCAGILMCFTDERGSISRSRSSKIRTS